MITGIREQTGFFFPGKFTNNVFLPVNELLEKPCKPEDLLGKVDELLMIEQSTWQYRLFFDYFLIQFVIICLCVIKSLDLIIRYVMFGNTGTSPGFDFARKKRPTVCWNSHHHLYSNQYRNTIFSFLTWDKQWIFARINVPRKVLTTRWIILQSWGIPDSRDFQYVIFVLKEIIFP